MCRALSAAAVLAGAWCALPRNRDSFPPIVLNITDGEASDATPQTLLAEAGSIKSVATRDGNVLLFNIHLAGSGTQTSAQCFPSNREELPCIRYADLLYDMSSELPACYDDLHTRLAPRSLPAVPGGRLQLSRGRALRHAGHRYGQLLLRDMTRPGPTIAAIAESLLHPQGRFRRLSGATPVTDTNGIPRFTVTAETADFRGGSRRYALSAQVLPRREYAPAP